VRLGSVVIRGWTCDQSVSGSDTGQAVHTHVPLSRSSIIWYRPNGGDATGLEWRKVMAAYRQVRGFGHMRADCMGPGAAPEPYAPIEYGDYT